MKTIKIEVKKEAWQDKAKINRGIASVKIFGLGVVIGSIVYFLGVLDRGVVIGFIAGMGGLVYLNCHIMNKAYDEYINEGK